METGAFCRAGTGGDLPAESQVNCAENDEVLFFIDRHKLMGRGIGLIDMHLLASCHMISCPLWTKDKRLQGVAEEMSVAVR